MSVGSSSRIVPSAWPAFDDAHHVADVLLGALAEDVGEVAALHLEQREEVGVLGHELHGHLGAAVEVHERRRRRVERGALLAAEVQPDARRPAP